MDNWPYCDWSNPHIRKHSFGLVTPESARYVAGYIHTKLSGDLAEEEYINKNREPVFRLSSQGIGKTTLIAIANNFKKLNIHSKRSTTSSTPLLLKSLRYGC